MDAEIKKILENHEKRLKRLEGEPISRVNDSAANGRKTLTKVILSSRDSGNFSSPKTAEEIHEKIQRSYPCEINRVAVALLRLSKRKQLRIASKTVSGKKHKAYTW